MEWHLLENKVPAQYEWVLVKTDLCRYPCVVAEYRANKFIDTNGVVVFNVREWKEVFYNK